MDHRFTFSIFTLEINGRPTLALQAKKHRDAERLCEHDRLRTELSTITSGGTPLCDASATMKVRLATAEEAVLIGKQRNRPSHQVTLTLCILWISMNRPRVSTLLRTTDPTRTSSYDRKSARQSFATNCDLNCLPRAREPHAGSNVHFCTFLRNHPTLAAFRHGTFVGGK